MGRNSHPEILCINPWIYDFAAHDFFARPLGLLSVAGALRAQGYGVRLIDCTGASPQPNSGVTGRLPKEITPMPTPLAGLPRRYGRYGIPEKEFVTRLTTGPRPAAVAVTSLMTYWYPGVQAVIRLVRRHLPGVPVILGGIYATLCLEHAQATSGADLVLPGPGESSLLTALAEITGGPAPDMVQESQSLTCYPALDLLPSSRLIPLLTSRGCPFTCSYCASRILQPRWEPRSPDAVVDELAHWHTRWGATEVALYDDALLVNPRDHLLPILEGVRRRGLPLRFHTPNGLHVGLITPEVAHWLHLSRFDTLRLGLETNALGTTRRDHKVKAGDLEEAMVALTVAGFPPRKIGVYLMVGLPGQLDEEVVDSIRAVRALGATPVLTFYSPIPHTTLWEEACRISRYDLAAEPLAQNNSIFPCWPEFSWPRYTRLKNLAVGQESP